ncbi:MAG: hypothetical protein ACLFSE_05255 [Spirochaetia bacterium]
MKAEPYLISTGDRLSPKEASRRNLSILVKTEKSSCFTLYRISVKNNDASPIAVDAAGISFSGFAPSAGDWRIFMDPGKCAWTGVKRLDYLDDDPRMMVIEEQETGLGKRYSDNSEPGRFHRSDLLTAVWDKTSGTAFLAGFLCQYQGGNKIDIRPVSGRNELRQIDAWQRIDTALDPGSDFRLDVLAAGEGNDPCVMLEAYGDQVSRYIGRRFDDPPVTGMMTWYGYRAAVTEEIVLRNAEIIRDVFTGYPQKTHTYMLLDHGWQFEAEWGSMNHNPGQFPHGIAWLADKIKQFGLKFGLWHTPFCVTEYVRDKAALTPLMAADKNGTPLEGKAAVWGSVDIKGRGRWRRLNFFDGAKPEVLKRWAAEMGLIRKWGADYCKLDFFNPLKGEETGKNISQGELLKNTWDALRRGFGWDGHLAPCSCETNLQLGYCDSVRIAADIGIAGTWPGAFEGYRYGHSTIAASWFKNRRFWVNDADSVQVGNGCSLGEARTRTTAAALSGGHLMTGDDLSRISADRLELIRRVLPMIPHAARPLDLFENPFPEGYPSLWCLDAEWPEGPRKTLAVFNLTRSTQRYLIHPEWLGVEDGTPFCALEWWQYRWLGRFSSSFEIEVPPEDTAVIHGMPLSAEPRIVSVSHHITGGYILSRQEFDSDSGRLHGSLRTKPGLNIVLLGYAPEQWVLDPHKAFHCAGSGLGSWQYELVTAGPDTEFSIFFRKKG